MDGLGERLMYTTDVLLISGRQRIKIISPAISIVEFPLHWEGILVRIMPGK